MTAAVVERVRLEHIHEMNGTPPAGFPTWDAFGKSIPLFEGIVFAELTEGDPNPMFITFDIMYVGAKSRNNLVYKLEMCRAIANQLKGKGAKFGHSDWGSNGTPEDVADWVGVMQEGNIFFAKLYVPPGVARTQISRIKKRHGKIKTSFEGYGVRVPIFDDDGEPTGEFWLKDFELGAIDLVRDIDAALADYQSGEPIFSSETEQKSQTKENPMSTPITLADIPPSLRAELRQEWERESKSVETARRVTELETANATLTRERDAAREEVTGLKATATESEQKLATAEKRASDAETKLAEAAARIADFERGEFARLLETTVAGFTASWNVSKAENRAELEKFNRQFLRALKESLGDHKDAAVVKETAEKVWKEEFESSAERLRNSFAGGAAHIGGSSQPKGWAEFTQEEIDRARAEMGV